MDSGVLTFASEQAAAVRPEIYPLLQENWKEVTESYPDSVLKPNFEFYLALGERLRLFTARVDGMLVGYVVVMVIQHPHRTNDTVGAIDTMYVLPVYRTSGRPKSLLRFAEDSLRDEGVKYLTFSVRTSPHERWLRGLGYRHTETIMERKL